MTVDPGSLAALFHRRWSVPVLAEMEQSGGCRVAALTHRLGAARQPVRDALATLIELGLVAPNPGYGHPLRPEYVLTTRGGAVGPACSALMTALERAGAVEIGLRKWSMPTLAAVGLGAARFGAIARELAGATDRAVSHALGALGEAGLVERAVEGGRPPAPRYALTHTGAIVHAPVLELAAA